MASLDLDAIRIRAQASRCVWCGGTGVIKELPLPFPRPDYPCAICKGTGHPELARDVLALLDEIAKIRDPSPELKA